MNAIKPTASFLLIDNIADNHTNIVKTNNSNKP